MNELFPKTRSAAAALSKDRKELATALAIEIPSQKRGGAADRESVVADELAAAAAALVEDGNEYTVENLALYRKTALWVGGGNSPSKDDWTGGSYTLHKEAYSLGMTKRAFLAWYAKQDNPTVDSLRKKHGKAQTNTGKSGSPTVSDARAVLDKLPAADKAKLATDLVSQKAVKDEIRKSPPIVTDQFIDVANKVLVDSRERGEEHLKKSSKTVVGNAVVSDLERIVNHLSAVAQLAASVNFEVVKYGVKENDDLFSRMTTLLDKSEQYIAQIREALEVADRESI